MSRDSSMVKTGITAWRGGRGRGRREGEREERGGEGGRAVRGRREGER